MLDHPEMVPSGDGGKLPYKQPQSQEHGVTSKGTVRAGHTGHCLR